MHDFPRCLIQVVLQVQSAPENDYVNTRLNMPGPVRFALLFGALLFDLCCLFCSPLTRQDLGVLPALLQSAVLALLSGSIPMRTTATAVSFAILPGQEDDAKSKIVSNFSPREAAAARSTHVFAFSAQDDKLLLAESEGEFTMFDWDEVLAAARKICCSGQGHSHALGVTDSMALDSDGSISDDPNLQSFLRSTMQGKLEDALQWKAAPRD